MGELSLPARQVWTGARLRGAPTRVRTALLAVEAVAAIASVCALITAHSTATTFVRFAVLAALCVAFEEIALQVGKLRLLISTGPQPDMTSVWTFAGALVLPAGYAALLAMGVAVHVWLRRQRAAGQYLYRKVYTAATIVLACLASTSVGTAVSSQMGAPAGVRTAVAIVVAAVAYTSVNRLLVVAAARTANPQAELSIVGSWEDNALELSTLCLAIMTAIVLLHEPVLALLVLLPMVLLQRGALVKQLETAAAIDSKTQLLNPVAWQQAAHRELARLNREERGAALLLIDLDHFKAVNDNHGHLVGDAALRAVGDKLKRALREYDIVGRFGGEEFVVLLPGVDETQGIETADRVRTAIGSIHLANLAEGGSGALACSIGVAVFPQHGVGVTHLLHSADAALYFAKRGGRDRVVIARSE
jgi:diguanylate cyclase (GGDEF)-like protein